MPERQRKPTRQKNWDYSTPGFYFFTIVVNQHTCLLGEVVANEMILSPAGEIARQTWLALPEHYPHVRVEPFVIMPNHVHGIIELRNTFDKSEFAFGRGGFRNPPLQENNFTLQDANLDPQKMNKSTLSNSYSTQHGLSEIVRGFKTWSARRINEIHGTTGAPVWQRSFYDSIIRNEAHLRTVELYILENPCRWKEDSENR